MQLTRTGWKVDDGRHRDGLVVGVGEADLAHRFLPRAHGSKDCAAGSREVSLGTEIVRVPLGFQHPKDSSGRYIPGAHLAVLYELEPGLRSEYQVYENASEGTPVSPVFSSADMLIAWLLAQGISRAAAEAFLRQGFAPSFVIKSDGSIVSGIEGANELRRKT